MSKLLLEGQEPAHSICRFLYVLSILLCSIIFQISHIQALVTDTFSCNVVIYSICMVTK